MTPHPHLFEDLCDYEQFFDPSDFDDEPSLPGEMVICSACNGSGEGMYDGSCCSTCSGSGEVFEETEGDEDD